MTKYLHIVIEIGDYICLSFPIDDKQDVIIGYDVASSELFGFIGLRKGTFPLRDSVNVAILNIFCVMPCRRPLLSITGKGALLEQADEINGVAVRS